MKPLQNMTCVLFCTMLLFSCGTDTSPTGPGGHTDSDYATVIITTIDEHGTPVPEVALALSLNDGGVNYYYDSDDSGVAVIDSILPGEVVISSRIQDIVGEYNYIHYSYKKTLQAGYTYEVVCMFPRESVPVTVRAFENRENQYVPMTDLTATLTLVQNGDPYHITTGSDGSALIENAEPSALNILYNDLLFERNGLASFGSGTFAYEHGSLTLSLFSNSDPFQPSIIAPDDGSKQVSSAVELISEGFDFEDGELTDEAFLWTSSRDGELGAGQNLTADLSVGLHEITLKITDSCGGVSESSVSITVSHYDTDSYFPLPTYGYWKYELEPVSFILTNEWGETENWTLEEMTVTSNAFDSRSCLMTWAVEKDDVRVLSRYFCEDHLRFDGESIYVISTDEQLTVLSGPDSFDPPVEDLKATTTYSPEYLFLSDYRAPSAAGQTELTVTANSNTTNTFYGIGSHTYLENETITITYDPGSPVSLTTLYGTFDTIPVTSRIGSFERTMYLAPGIGIVQLDIMLSETPVTALLQETNMESYVPAPRIARGVHPFSQPAAVTLSSDEDRLVQVRRILRSLSPF